MKIASAFILLLTAACAGAFVPLSQKQSTSTIRSTSSTATILAATASEKKQNFNANGESSGAALAAVQLKPNGVIQAMAQGMNLLKPFFAVEAQLQAFVLGRLGNIDPAQVSADIESVISKNKLVIYTYSLSPFSSEAVRLLTESGHDFEQVELGAEWFLLGAKESVARVELSKFLSDDKNGATSLPKIFISGKCIGGCADLGSLIQSGEFDLLMKQQNKVAAPKEKLFGLF